MKAIQYKHQKPTKKWKTIDKDLPQGHLIRLLSRFVQSINLSFLEAHLSTSRRGQHPIPLRIPVAVWLYAYFHGEQRYRQVSKACKSDDIYYWISECYCPSPAYFEKWKLHLFAELPKYLDELRVYLRDNGFIENEIIGLDGVKIQVWASLSQSKTEASIIKEIEKIDDRLRKLKQNIPTRSLSYRKNKLETRLDELRKRKADATHLSPKEKEKIKINITSPSTNIMIRKENRVIQGVNAQLIINQDQLINVHFVSRQPMDNGFLCMMLNMFLTFWRHSVLYIYLLCDSGYYGIKDMKNIPPEIVEKIIMPSPVEVMNERKKVRVNQGGGWTIQNGFTFNTSSNTITCPQNHELTLSRIEKRSTSRDKQIYHAPKSVCNNCPSKAKCLGRIKAERKTIKIAVSIPELDRLAKNYADHKAIYKKRAIINEPVHSQMLNNLGIVKLHTIAQKSIEGEVAMLILVHTIKKLNKKHGQDWMNNLRRGCLIYIFFPYQYQISPFCLYARISGSLSISNTFPPNMYLNNIL